MQWSNSNKYKFFLLWPQDEEDVFIGSTMGELVLKLIMITPRTVTQRSALTSYQIFETSINSDFTNCWS